MTTQSTHRRGEQGIALIITLFLMASMSALAVSLMFLSNTETSASRNYKTMSQARYAGEAGVHKALNYMLNTYPVPATSAGYVTTGAHVTWNGNPVVLSWNSASSNYPVAAVVTAFAAAAQGSLAAGTGTVNFAAEARLISMRDVTVYGGGAGVVQTWEITATGTVPGPIAGTPAATVEVTAMIERDIVDAQTFAVFATGTGCGAINLGGNVSTASYDSRVGNTVTSSGGNVGTNGNMSINGSVDVYGSLSSPRTGVGSCSSGAVTALTSGGSATIHGNNIIQLPQAITFTPPALPSPMPPISSMSASASTCSDITVFQAPAVCSWSGGVATVDPNGSTVELGNISGDWTFKGGNYSINSIGSGSLQVSAVPSTVGGATKVILNLAGKTATGDMATVYDTSGNGFRNSSMDPQKLQILYAGSGAIEMTGATDAAFMLYAPNASVTTHGNADIWGSVLARQVTSSGTPRFIYDRAMASQFFTMGNYVMSSFSWKKY